LQSKVEQSGPTGSRKYRVLIVDDELDITLSFKMALEDSGFRVDSFNEPLNYQNYDVYIPNVQVAYFMTQFNSTSSTTSNKRACWV
jgi:PleD family two-component response regulator